MTAPAVQAGADELAPVAPNIFAFAQAGGRKPHLIGGRCSKCGRYYFPQPDCCEDCQVLVDPIDIGSRGTIYSHTTVRTRPPYGLPRPYAVGLIDLAEAPLRIFCLLNPASIGGFRIGQAVELCVGALGHDGHDQACLRPFFSPVTD